ncbi:MAG: DUF3015 family protein [Bdellovibrionales bacterium]
MKKLIALLSIFAFAGSFAFADTKKRPAKGMSEPMESYEVPWGMAGCSIWNYVIKDKEQGPQIGVWALEHLVFGVQISAITTGTSNCVEAPGMKHAQNEQEVFVNVNLASLQKEAAQGQGRHLDTLAEIFGCENKASFAQLSQNRYEAIFSKEEASSVVEQFKTEIKSGKAGACSRAG